jgi:hypothetical protein
VIITFKVLHKRGFHVTLADHHAQSAKASVSFEGLRTTKEDTERIGRVMAEVRTLTQTIADVRRDYLTLHEHIPMRKKSYSPLVMTDSGGVLGFRT